MTSAAMVPHGGGGEVLTMIGSPGDARGRFELLKTFIREAMVPGVDYGEIPGTRREGDRSAKTLLQPGAQKLAEIYGLTHRFEVSRQEDWAALFFFYSVRAVLTRGERFVGEGYGSCNSRESRYAYRWAWERDVPTNLDANTLRRKTWTSGKRTFVKFRVPNEDIADQVNTILKMACKRALVHAVIAVTRSAEIFTQDLEDVDHGPPEAAEADDGLPPDPTAPPEQSGQAAPGPKGNLTADDVRKMMAEAQNRSDLYKAANLANGFPAERAALEEAYRAAQARLEKRG